MVIRLRDYPQSEYKPFRAKRPPDPFRPLKKPPIDLGKRRAKTAFLAQVVPDLVTSMRTFHMRVAAAGVQTYQRQGKVFQPGDPVITLVDGSPHRKVTNVRLGGNITYAQGPGLEDVRRAAQEAYLILLDISRKFRDTGQYEFSITMDVDGQITQPSRLGRFDQFEQIRLYPLVPYGGRIERHHEPFWTTYKVLRQSGWLNRVAMRLVISGHPTYRPVGKTKHASAAMPLLTFGKLGDFKSRGPSRSDFYG
ncbi:hypothetical protein [Primorskyibacter sp. S87]|uniref:hypothetical protein n=1 Tax=Primorskyibacter sp. S87 TaxID=3415126 RepID=UPI003C7C5DB0